MRGLIDCHVHTELCGHARGTTEECVAQAREQGLAAIVFTEHLPLPRELDPHNRLSMRESDLTCYCEHVAALRDRTPDIDIVLGVEADWLPGMAEYSKRVYDLAARAGVEVFLGSVHFLGAWAFDDPDAIGEWDTRDVDEVWRAYASTWCDAVLSGRFDVMAHPDLPKKFGHRPSFEMDALYTQMADAAARADVLVEISTAGLRKPVGEIYPAHAFLLACRERDVGVTIGSDAHSPAEVGWGLEYAVEAARAAGYTRVALPRVGGERTWFTL